MNDLLKINLLATLAALGDHKHLVGTLDIPTLNKGALVFALSDGIAYDVTLTNTGGAVLLDGKASAQTTTECSRCLDPAQLELVGEPIAYYVFPDHADQCDESDDETIIIDASGIVDIEEQILAAMIFAVPDVVLCSDDCAGLCATCGANLNEGPCSCDEQKIDPNHPFAALAQLQ
jgi:uncharacterized protein